MKATADLWRPLRTPIFRQLLIADVVSDVGTFMQGVGSACLMVSVGASPLRSGVVMFFASAPFALLPAIAHAVSGSAVGYGVLLGCFGVGAVGGAIRHAVGSSASVE